MESEKIPITTFDPMLRNLIYWDLVARVEEPSGHEWRLVERARLRLDEIGAEPVSEVEHMVFFDHCCSLCSFRRLTRLRGSRYVCDECSVKLERPPDTEAAVIPLARTREHHWLTPRRQRTA